MTDSTKQTAEHTPIERYRVPGADRLWPTRADAAYYNAPNADFTADDTDAVLICCECSGETATSLLMSDATVWPCPAVAGLNPAEQAAFARLDAIMPGWRDEPGALHESEIRAVVAAVQTVTAAETLSGPLAEVAAERAAQDAKWGEQNHPNGTGDRRQRIYADDARWRVEESMKDGTLTWSAILTEEFAEALAESDPVKLRTELIQVGAVAVAWAEAIDRYTATVEGRGDE